MGADPARVTVTGSLKFDAVHVPPPSAHGRPRERVLRFFRLAGSRPVVVAGSTMRGEERPVLQAFRRIKATQPQALLILAPRHTDRFTEVMHIARGEGFATARRTELAIDADPRADVVVLDTIGELAQVYQLATVAFVGGSLVPTGGHNILEPAVYGRPVVFGPSMTNFAEIAEMFLERGAAVQVHSEHELEETLITLMGDSVRRASHRRRGARAGGRQPWCDRANGRRAPSPAATACRGAAFPARALTRGHCQPAVCRARTPAAREGHGPPRRPTPPSPAGRQHRQPRRRGQRQDAALGPGRPTAG